MRVLFRGQCGQHAKIFQSLLLYISLKEDIYRETSYLELTKKYEEETGMISKVTPEYRVIRHHQNSIIL